MQRRHRDVKGGSRISGQHGDGMFVLRALLLHQVQLCDCGIEQRLLLRQVKPGSDPAGMTVFYQLQTLLLNVNRFLYHPGFSIEFTQAEVVGGELCGQHQIDVIHIGCRALQRGICGLQSSPVFSKEVRLVAEQKRNLVSALRERAPQGDDFGPMSRIPIASSIGIGAGLGK